MSTFSSANITDSNLVLKECTHRIKIKYSMHQYSIRLHNLGNWLILTLWCCHRDQVIVRVHTVYLMNIEQCRMATNPILTVYFFILRTVTVCLFVAERGYCVRGDLCPYDHGLDRVVLDNVGLPPTVLGLPGTVRLWNVTHLTTGVSK